MDFSYVSFFSILINESCCMHFLLQWLRDTLKVLDLLWSATMSTRLFRHYNRDVHGSALLLLMLFMFQRGLNMWFMLKGKFCTHITHSAPMGFGLLRFDNYNCLKLIYWFSNWFEVNIILYHINWFQAWCSWKWFESSCSA